MAVVEILAAVAIGLAAGSIIITVVDLTEYLFNDIVFKGKQPKIDYEHEENYFLQQSDKEYVDKSKEVLQGILGTNPANTLLQMDAEERLNALLKLTEELKILYQLEDINLQFTYEEDDMVLGWYCDSEKTISFNCERLMTTSEVITNHFLCTVFHEFRHAVQHKMISFSEGEKYIWCSDEANVKQMAEDFCNYISPEENLKAYYEQFVEIDAREIALYILGV